jgi:RNA polymerase sigma-70 factor (sigma-E family)
MAEMEEFEDAFEGLYGLAYRIAFRLLGRRGDAEDVAAEALARAYVRWSRVGAYPEAWVSRVSTNLALDLWRKERRPRGAPPTTTAIDGAAADRIDLHRALAALSKRQREVVALRYLADLPEETVAAALGCSTGTVKQHASRGLAALKQSPAVVAEEV